MLQGLQIKMTGGLVCDNVCLDNRGAFWLGSGGGTFSFVMSGGVITRNDCSSGTVGSGASNKNPTIFLNSCASQSVRMSGGIISGNVGSGVYASSSGLTQGVRCLYLSGEAILTGNAGIGFNSYVGKGLVVLNGDYTGRVNLYAASSSSWVGAGSVWGTNAAPAEVGWYAGAENIRGGSCLGQTDAQTGQIKAVALGNDVTLDGVGKTFANALANVQDGSVIRLLRDCDWPTGSRVLAARRFTIDGCGHRIFRQSPTNLVELANAGTDLTVTNVTFWGGEWTSYTIVTSRNDVVSGRAFAVGAGTKLTLAKDVGFRQFGSGASLVSVAAGGTVDLAGAAVTNTACLAVAAETGASVGLRGETRVTGNAGGDIAVPDGETLVLTGDFAGETSVTVAGDGPTLGQVFGLNPQNYAVTGVFQSPTAAKLRLSTEGRLRWTKPGLMIIFR